MSLSNYVPTSRRPAHETAQELSYFKYTLPFLCIRWSESNNCLPRGSALDCGWSAVGGQGQSAYVRGGFRPDDTFAGHSVSILEGFTDHS